MERALDDAKKMPMESMISGFAAGAAATLVGHPLDTIKGNLQSAQGGRTSIVRSASLIYGRGGIKSLYSGFAAPLVSLAVTSSVTFSAYSTFRSLLGASTSSVTEGREFDRHTPLAGAMIGPVLATINTPLELIKLQMQVNGHSQRNGYRNAAHALYNILRIAGPHSLYLGFSVNALREVAFSTCFFSSYELAAQALRGPLGMTIAVPAAGGLAALFAWIVTVPLDTVKSIVQAQDLRTARRLTPAGVVTQVWRAHGLAGFTRGAVASILRAVLANAVRLSVYESLLASLKRSRKEKEAVR